MKTDSVAAAAVAAGMAATWALAAQGAPQPALSTTSAHGGQCAQRSAYFHDSAGGHLTTVTVMGDGTRPLSLAVVSPDATYDGMRVPVVADPASRSTTTAIPVPRAAVRDVIVSAADGVGTQSCRAVSL